MSKMSLEERNKNLAEVGKPNRFSSDKQPSPEAKSKGAKKHWEWRRLRQDIFERITNLELADGRTVNFWDEATKILHQHLVSSTSKLDTEAKMKLLMKLIDMTPKTDNVNFESGDKEISSIKLEIVPSKSKNVDEKEKDEKNED